MKNHILTIILLFIAACAFTLRYYSEGAIQSICDVLAFALPTLAAIAEMYVAERESKKMAEELKKRPPFECLTEEELERRREEGSIDENTIYATVE